MTQQNATENADDGYGIRTPLQQAMEAATADAENAVEALSNASNRHPSFGLRFATVPPDDEPLIDPDLAVVDFSKDIEGAVDGGAAGGAGAGAGLAAVEDEADDDAMFIFTLTDTKIQPTGETMALREGGKLPYHLIPPEFNAMLAAILEYGADKYAARNYERGLPPEDLLRGAEAHLMALKAGELHDPESGLPHAGHAAWNLLVFGMQIMRQPVIGYAYQKAIHKTRSGGTQELIQQIGKQYGLTDFTKPALDAEGWTNMLGTLRKGDGKRPATTTETATSWTKVEKAT